MPKLCKGTYLYTKYTMLTKRESQHDEMQIAHLFSSSFLDAHFFFLIKNPTQNQHLAKNAFLGFLNKVSVDTNKLCNLNICGLAKPESEHANTLTNTYTPPPHHHHTHTPHYWPCGWLHCQLVTATTVTLFPGKCRLLINALYFTCWWTIRRTVNSRHTAC